MRDVVIVFSILLLLLLLISTFGGSIRYSAPPAPRYADPSAYPPVTFPPGYKERFEQQPAADAGAGVSAGGAELPLPAPAAHMDRSSADGAKDKDKEGAEAIAAGVSIEAFSQDAEFAAW